MNTDQFVNFLQTADIRKYYDMTMKPENPDFASAQLYFGRPDERMTAQALGIFGYINSMVNDLFIGIFAERRWAGSFSMRRIVREKGRRIIFVEYDLSVGETLGPMYRLMFDLALKEALGGRETDRGNTYLIIDEFKLLPDLMHIDDALNFGRSLGVKVCAGLQSIDQLYDIYGEDRGKVLAAGFMNSFCFQTFDLDSRKFIMERFGEKYENLSLHSRSSPYPPRGRDMWWKTGISSGWMWGRHISILSGMTPFSSTLRTLTIRIRPYRRRRHNRLGWQKGFMEGKNGFFR